MSKLLKRVFAHFRPTNHSVWNRRHGNRS